MDFLSLDAPRRIVCLTEEPTEWLYMLGEQHRIVGISGFTVRPAAARKEKPKVSAFLDADIEKIMALEPDLVIGFSDIQASIAQKLIRQGLTVWIQNYRSVAGIFQMMQQLGAIVGKASQAQTLIKEMQQFIKDTSLRMSRHPVKPRIYFEEWYDPMICGIRWVSELIELAGGEDIFAGKRNDGVLARGRIIKEEEVLEGNPDIMIGSWCGKKFKKEQVTARRGWEQLRALQRGALYEIKSSVILQPGPAAVTEGFRQLVAVIEGWHAGNAAEGGQPVNQALQ